MSQPEYEELDRIAYEVVNKEGQSGFLHSFSMAWITADPENKDILFHAWMEIVAKYGLDKVKKR